MVQVRFECVLWSALGGPPHGQDVPRIRVPARRWSGIPVVVHSDGGQGAFHSRRSEMLCDQKFPEECAEPGFCLGRCLEDMFCIHRRLSVTVRPAEIRDRRQAADAHPQAVSDGRFRHGRHPDRMGDLSEEPEFRPGLVVGAGHGDVRSPGQGDVPSPGDFQQARGEFTVIGSR